MVAEGQKSALLVGCNYPNTPYELRGCHNDVLAMHELLINRFGFNKDKVDLLIDKPGSSVIPTGANVKKALEKMIDLAKPGDVLFFHFSGHGTLIKPHFSSKKEEAIVPCDFNLVTSKFFGPFSGVDFRELVNQVPQGATFTFLSDSCHSGGLIDKETEQIGPSGINEKNMFGSLDVSGNSHKPKTIPIQSIIEHLTSLTNISTSDIGTHLMELFGPDAGLPFCTTAHEHDSMAKPLKPDEGILLSGCQANETSADVEITENGRMGYGAFTHAIQMVLKENLSPLSNRQVVLLARNILRTQHFDKQHPCLYCNDKNADAIFLSQADRQP
ncbi:latex-abundant family protein [Dorcoceras hygrometricum]|nr:latex-abundant family protein [Dorcoceras hygrometricum]